MKLLLVKLRIVIIPNNPLNAVVGSPIQQWGLDGNVSTAIHSES